MRQEEDGSTCTPVPNGRQATEIAALGNESRRGSGVRKSIQAKSQLGSPWRHHDSWWLTWLWAESRAACGRRPPPHPRSVVHGGCQRPPLRLRTWFWALTLATASACGVIEPTTRRRHCSWRFNTPGAAAVGCNILPATRTATLARERPGRHPAAEGLQAEDRRCWRRAVVVGTEQAQSLL